MNNVFILCSDHNIVIMKNRSISTDTFYDIKNHTVRKCIDLMLSIKYKIYG